MRLARARSAYAASAVAILVWLAALATNGASGGWDPAILAQFQLSPRSSLVRPAQLLTQLGGWIPLTIIGLIGFGVLAVRRRRRAALLLFILFGGRLLVELQKWVIAAPRPPASGFLAPVESLGFPSAHAANSMITFVGIALLVPVVRRRRAFAVAIGFTLAVLIGLSRLLLGVHWPSDVIGGWAFALFWIALCIRLASAPPDAEAPVAGR
jgi:undecaprenyl-diphosphatase